MPNPAWIYSEKNQSLHVTATAVGQAQQLFPGKGPYLVRKLVLIAGLQNDGIILIGNTTVGPLGVPGGGGTGYIDQLSPGDQKIYLAKDEDLTNMQPAQPGGQFLSIPEFLNASSIWTLIDTSNPFFGAGLNCWLSIVVGTREIGYYG